jgi:general secretion pathway protein I
MTIERNRPRPVAALRRPGRRVAGFTLIEVVVAFLLLSLVMASGFELFTTGMRRAGDLEDRAQALVVAQSRLAGVGIENALKEGVYSGQTEDGKYAWTLAIARSTEGQADPNQQIQTAYGLYRVEVTVQWRGADQRDQSLSLATLELGSIL